MIRFLSIDDVSRLHELTVTTHGGATGIRDIGLLDAAVSMPMQTFGGDYLHDGVGAMAAANLFHLCQAHAFVDGNKRTGVLAALVFQRTRWGPKSSAIIAAVYEKCGLEQVAGLPHTRR